MTGTSAQRRRIVVVTGSRADFGLLTPIITAIHREHEKLELQLIVAGSHMLDPATLADVQRVAPIAARIPMQRAEQRTRLADARAVGVGVAGFAEAYAALQPEWVLVLGDRIEAFAAAAAASIGGWALAHVHGGDRAEGVADEAMRHAITKLSHLHFPATVSSAERLIRMGEDSRRVHVVGSPALDVLDAIEPLPDTAFAALGEPECVVLWHPTGRTDDAEEAAAYEVALGARSAAARTLVLAPNLDAGRDGTVRGLDRACAAINDDWGAQPRLGRVTQHGHLPRHEFLALLRRVKVLVGNSSAGLIEAAALGLPVVDVGTRQAGRERACNVLHVLHEDRDAISLTITRAASTRPNPNEHPFGDGRAGQRIAQLLASTSGHDMLRKLNAY